MLTFEDDSHFELEAEIAILKRTCTRPSCFSYVEPRSTNRQAITTIDLPLNTYCESTCCTGVVCSIIIILNMLDSADATRQVLAWLQ
jgi:hypothetical protein